MSVLWGILSKIEHNKRIILDKIYFTCMRVLPAGVHEHRDWHQQRPEGGLWALDLEVQRAVTAICQSSQCSERLSPLSSLTSDHWVVFEEQYRCARFVAEPLVISYFYYLK